MKKRILSVLLVVVLLASQLGISAMAAPETKAVSAANDRYFGVDVSYFQGDIDWEAAAERIDFAIIRCGYAGNREKYDDEKWEYNVSECVRLGIPYGVYIYSYAKNTADAADEAAHVLRLLEGHMPDLPVYYDIEDRTSIGNLSDAKLLEVVETFCDTIADAGFVPGVYADMSMWTNRLTSSAYDSYEKWIAWFTKQDAFRLGNFGMWQYGTFEGIPGMEGPVDMNICVIDVPGVLDLPFTDVTGTDWFRGDVRYTYENAIMNGTGTGVFSPDSPISRGRALEILYRMEDMPEVSQSCPFADVTPGSHYEKAVSWAAENGIVEGSRSEAFEPEAAITREQMAVILYRYAEYKGCDVSARKSLSGYSDTRRISAYALDELSWANATGLIIGNTAGALNPTGAAQRCQVAAIMHRFCENVLQIDAA